MVWHEVEHSGLRVVLIDGFAPPAEIFRNLELWESRLTRRRDGLIPGELYWQRIHDYVKPGAEPTESQLLSAFAVATKGLRHSYCPYIDRHREPWLAGDPFRCLHASYTTGTNRSSLERGMYASRIRHNPEAFTAEFQVDRQNNRPRYMAHCVAYVPGEPEGCDRFEECCGNWVGALNFQVKPEGEYANLPLFLNAWTRELTRLGDALRGFRERYSPSEVPSVRYRHEI